MLTVHLHTFAVSMLASHVFCSECILCAYANKERPYQLPSCTLLQDILPANWRKQEADSSPILAHRVQERNVCAAHPTGLPFSLFCWLTG